MADTQIKNQVWGMGPDVRVARCRFTPAGSGTSETLTEAAGITRVARGGAGAWTGYLADTKVKDMEVIVTHIENDTTLFHFTRPETIDVATGSFTFSHKSVAYASVASGPSASDTVDQMQVVVLYRVID